MRPDSKAMAAALAAIEQAARRFEGQPCPFPVALSRRKRPTGGRLLSRSVPRRKAPRR